VEGANTKQDSSSTDVDFEQDGRDTHELTQYWNIITAHP